MSNRIEWFRTGTRRRHAAVLGGLTAALPIAVGAVAAALALTASQVPAAPRAEAAPSGVSCRTAAGVTRSTAGELFAVQDADVLGPGATMTESGQIGSGFTGSTFAWTGSGGDGVLYALTWTGELRWYRYDSGASTWTSGSGRTVGTGLTPRVRIANIALGGDGSFYVVRTNGQLVVFRHTGRLTGAATWANSSGWLIGSGWTGRDIIVPNGDGTVYRQRNGKLYWHRHTDPALGAVTWSSTRLLGTGWKYYDVLPAGAGVIVATRAGTGEVLVYRHADPVGGSDAWAGNHGVRKFTARPDSFGITIDPQACRIP